MKLTSREPTPEMLFAARFYKEGQHTLACAWRAMYDAAPEVNVQAEIAKRDARIAELERVGGKVMDDFDDVGYWSSAKQCEALAEIESLRQQLAAALVDAQRYRWLRDEKFRHNGHEKGLM